VGSPAVVGGDSQSRVKNLVCKFFKGQEQCRKDVRTVNIGSKSDQQNLRATTRSRDSAEDTIRQLQALVE
jgi:hypothetical protein